MRCKIFLSLALLGLLMASVSGALPAQANGATPVAQSSPTAAPAAAAQALPTTIRIDVGGPGFKDAASGLVWEADHGYWPAAKGGPGSGYWGPRSMQVVATSRSIAGTTASAIYQTQRLYASGYRFDLPNGAYRVTLRLASIYVNARPGSHVFDVYAQGVRVLSAVDAAATSSIYVAVDHVFTTTVTAGVLDVTFSVKNGHAAVAALDVEPDRPVAAASTPVGTTAATPAAAATTTPTGAPTVAMTATVALSPSPAPATTATVAVTATQAATPTLAVAATMPVTATVAVTATKPVTPTLAATAVVTPTMAPTQAPTSVPTATIVAAPPTATATSAASATATPVPPTQTATAMPTRTTTASSTALPIAAPSPTTAVSPLPVITSAPTPVLSATPSGTATKAPSSTATAVSTASRTPSASPTAAVTRAAPVEVKVGSGDLAGLKDNGYTVVFHPADRQGALDTLNAALDIKDRISNELGLGVGTIEIRLFSTREEYNTALGTTVPADQVGNIVNRQQVWLLAPRADNAVERQDILKGVQVEIVRLAMLDVANMPAWLRDGLASYEARLWDDARQQFMRGMVAMRRITSLRALDGPTYNYLGGAVTAHTVVEYFVSAHGAAALPTLVENMMTLPFEQALQRTTGATLAAFDRGWVAYVNSTYAR